MGGASQQILLAAGGKSATQSAREKERRTRRRRCVIPAAVPTSGTHLCSLSVPALPSHSWEFSHQIRLAFSQENRRHRVRHVADPDHGQLLIARWWPLNPSHDVQITSCLSATLTLTSSNTALISFTLAVLVQETVATVLLCRSQPSRGG